MRFSSASLNRCGDENIPAGSLPAEGNATTAVPRAGNVPILGTCGYAPGELGRCTSEPGLSGARSYRPRRGRPSHLPRLRTDAAGPSRNWDTRHSDSRPGCGGRKRTPSSSSDPPAPCRKPCVRTPCCRIPIRTAENPGIGCPPGCNKTS